MISHVSQNIETINGFGLRSSVKNTLSIIDSLSLQFYNDTLRRIKEYIMKKQNDNHYCVLPFVLDIMLKYNPTMTIALESTESGTSHGGYNFRRCFIALPGTKDVIGIGTLPVIGTDAASSHNNLYQGVLGFCTSSWCLIIITVITFMG